MENQPSTPPSKRTILPFWEGTFIFYSLVLLQIAYISSYLSYCHLLPIPTDTLANQETVILIGLFKEVFGSSQLIDGHPEFEASLQPSQKKKLIDSKPGLKPKNDDTMSKIRLIPQMHHVGWILTVDGRNPAPLGIYKTL